MGGKNPAGYIQEYYQENREAILARNRKWRENNKEQHLRRAREYHHENRDRVLETKRQHRKNNQEAYRDRYLRKKYGVSSATYDAMAALQKDKCASCGDITALVVDHNHSTGEVRALLCSPCNTAIGLLKEDPKRMRAAIKYLARFK